MTTLAETPGIALLDDDGRHRLGRPGLAQRRDLVVQVRRRARHRRTASRLRMTTQGVAILIAIIALAVMMVGGWYAAPGAHAVAQMLAQ
jgi:hypothetical protein